MVAFCFKHLLLVTLIVVPVFCNERAYTVRGTLPPDLKGKFAVLSFSVRDSTIIDTAVIGKDGFAFTGSVPNPLLAQLSVAANDTTINREFFLENEQLQFDVRDDGVIHISGSRTNEEFDALIQKIQALSDQRDAIAKRYDSVKNDLLPYSKSRKDSLLKQMEFDYDSLEEAKNPVYRQFISEHPSSYVSLFALGQLNRYVVNTKLSRQALHSFPVELQQSVQGQEIRSKIEFAEKTDSGKVAPPFSQKDTAGVLVSSKQFKGNFILLDFWASWCLPCRKENPNLLRLFAANKDRRFKIVGVGLERNKDNWLKAIREDGLVWTQVSDLKFFENAIAKEYGIWSIPQNILINPDGIIIGKNLKAEQIQALLDKHR